MLFAQKLLAPVPQPKHPGNVNPLQVDPRQSRGFTMMKLLFELDSFSSDEIFTGI